MAKSILQKDKECFLCTRMQDLEQHHIFGGPNRKWSEIRDRGFILIGMS